MAVMDIGVSALRTAYTQLQTTSHNIANASTPGYSRQETVLTSLDSQFGASGFVGGGVDVETIQRRYDQHLTREMNTASAMSNADRTRAESLARLDRLFSNSENGLGVQYDQFNASLADLVNQPFDNAARNVALQRAHNFADSFSSADAELDRLRDDADRQAGQVVSELNNRLVELARLNGRIAVASGGEHAPNDLLDQRDELIEQINGSLQSATYLNDDGTVSLFAATGDALVLGTEPVKLALDRQSDDPERMRLILLTAGEPVPLNQERLGGGELAGLIMFRNDDLDSARTRLGQMAGALGSAYNGQQALGLDANGDAGAPVFNIGGARALAASANTGNAQLAVSIANGAELKASDYNLQMAGGQYVLTRTSDGEETILSGLPATFDGLDITLQSGAMAEGDSILLETGSAFAGNFSAVMTTPEQWATAYAAIPALDPQNSGSLAVTAFDVTQIDANTPESVSLVFGADGTVTVTGNGTGNPGPMPWQAGEPISFNGWEMTIVGQPAAGDTVSVSAPVSPEADNRNARALLDLGDQSLVGGRPANQAVGSLIGEVGALSLTASTNADQSAAWYNNAVAARDQVSGVNLDEEAARLIQYQQAYQAAARLISTSQTMFESLMASV